LTSPEEAASYLNAAYEDSPEMFLEALKDVAQAQQMKRVAQETNVNRESLYRSLSKEGNPAYKTLVSVLTFLKIKPTFEAIEEVTKPSSPMPPTIAEEIENGAAIGNGLAAQKKGPYSTSMGGGSVNQFQVGQALVIGGM
jgi:probable addiction module antidote protein